MVGRIYKDDHYTLLHTKYERSEPCGFGEEDFFYVFPMTPPGRALYGPPGTRLAGFIKSSPMYCYTQNKTALGLVVSENIFFLVFPTVSLWERITTGAGKKIILQDIT